MDNHEMEFLVVMGGMMWTAGMWMIWAISVGGSWRESTVSKATKKFQFRIAVVSTIIYIPVYIYVLNN